VPPSISPSLRPTSIHADEPTQSPSSLLLSDFGGPQSQLQSQSHHAHAHAHAQPQPRRPSSSMSLSFSEARKPMPYAAQPQLSPIESYRPLPPDSARSSRAPTPQLGGFSRLGLEGIDRVPSRRERAGSVDSGPPRSAADLFLASSIPKQTASEKVLAAISGAYGVAFACVQ
jgi:hypothetical protein